MKYEVYYWSVKKEENLDKNIVYSLSSLDHFFFDSLLDVVAFLNDKEVRKETVNPHFLLSFNPNHFNNKKYWTIWTHLFEIEDKTVSYAVVIGNTPYPHLVEFEEDDRGKLREKGRKSRSYTQHSFKQKRVPRHASHACNAWKIAERMNGDWKDWHNLESLEVDIDISQEIDNAMRRKNRVKKPGWDCEDWRYRSHRRNRK